MTGETFAALPPVPVTLVIDGEPLDLTPIRVGELPAFARAVQPAVTTLSASLSGSPDWLMLMAEHGETVIEAVAIASRRPVDWVADLGLDEAVRLTEAVFEVNADFFIQRVLPGLTEAAARISQILGARSTGATQSSA